MKPSLADQLKEVKHLITPDSNFGQSVFAGEGEYSNLTAEQATAGADLVSGVIGLIKRKDKGSVGSCGSAPKKGVLERKDRFNKKFEAWQGCVNAENASKQAQAKIDEATANALNKVPVSKGGMPTWGYIAIGLTVVAVLGTAIIIVKRKK